MTRDDQIRFVRRITSDVADVIAARIRSGEIPGTWEGAELRQYICDVVAPHKMERKRKRDYNNDKLVNGL